LLGGISDGVTVQNAQGQVVFANDKAARLCGFSDVESFLKTPVEDVLARFAMLDETGASLDPSSLPGWRALAGETPEPLIVGALDRRTGSIRWTLVRAAPIRSEFGAPELVLNVFHDITAVHRDRQTAHLLEKAAEELASSLDYEAALAGVAQVLVPSFADVCAVELLEGEELRTVALAHADPSMIEHPRRIRASSPPRRDARSPVGRVLASGEPLLIATLTDADVAACARDAEHLETLRGLKLRSMLCAPIAVAGGGTEGAIVLVSAESRRRFDEHDLRFARALGRRAGTAVGHARAYRAANDAVRARDDFLSVAGHELRTPLATLVLQLESLKRALATGVLSPKTASDRVQKTLAQTNRLNRLIDTLLDVTRVSSGKLVLEPEPMDLAALVRDICERFTEEASRANVSLTVTTETPCEGFWDPRRLDQVVSNLLSNAIKYGEGRPIRVTCERQADADRIRVIDQGMGIASDDLERIFSRFERAPPSRDRSGFGLGLWIARAIVVAHGGTLGVESEPGKGATFTLELPRRHTFTR